MVIRPAPRPVLVLLGAVLTATATVAAPLIDPYLEQFRVGRHADPDGIALDADGWPRDLFAPLEIDSLWCAAAARYFEPERLRQEHRWLAWRIAIPALGPVGAQDAWYGTVRARALALAALPQEPPDDASGVAYLRAPILAWRAMAFARAGKTGAARRVMDALLSSAGQLGLGPEEVLIWSLRRRALDGVPGAGADEREPWPELLDLGPFDAASGWALWVAHRRHLGRPVLPPGCGDRREVQSFLAGLRESWLAEADLDGAALPAGFHAALGAVVLPRGAALDRHLARFPDPPPDDRDQVLWVGGVRRQHGHTAAITEDLAGRPDLGRTLRLDLWRRASERRILAGEWDAGLDDLGQALALLDGRTGRGEARRLADWLVQLLALADARGLDSRASTIMALARARLDADGWLELVKDGGAYGILDPSSLPVTTPPLAADRLGEARRRVLAGDAAGLEDGARRLPAESGPSRDRLWDLWCDLGAWLAARAAAEGAAVAGRDAYRDALDAVARISVPVSRRSLACAAVGVFLRARPQRDRVLAWLIACDLADEERDLPRPNSPLPDLSRELGTGHEAALVRHALLGVALASSDAAGQLSLAVSLPQGPLPLDDRLRLLYPLPSSPVVRESLAATGLPVSLLLAIARNESAFESAARSRAGALGWMQIMPFHYPDRGLPAGRAVWREPRTSVALGARILAGSATRLGGDPYRALAAYNAGDGAVRRWDEQLGGDATRSQFLAWIGYPETRRYVEKVLIDRAIYDWMLERATEPSSGP